MENNLLLSFKWGVSGVIIFLYHHTYQNVVVFSSNSILERAKVCPYLCLYVSPCQESFWLPLNSSSRTLFSSKPSTSQSHLESLLQSTYHQHIRVSRCMNHLVHYVNTHNDCICFSWQYLCPFRNLSNHLYHCLGDCFNPYNGLLTL